MFFGYRDFFNEVALYLDIHNKGLYYLNYETDVKVPSQTFILVKIIGAF